MRSNNYIHVLVADADKLAAYLSPVVQSKFRKEVRMFQSYEVAQGGTGRRLGSILGSLLLQVVLVVAAIVLPMMFTDTISLAKTVVGTPLVAPPPPPAPAPPKSKPTQSRPVTKVKKVFVLTTPNSIPKDVPRIIDEMPIPEVAVNNGGVQGGVPGGTGNVKDGVVGSIPVAPPPPPPPAKEPPKEVKVATPQVVNVSSGVQAAKLVKKVIPVYPPLAKQARQQGTVRLTAIIGIDGLVQNLTLVGGPPLLVAAAMDAVKHWTYQPTLLNNVPVTVVTTIDVIFTLSQ